MGFSEEDLRILSELQRDCRQSLKELSKKLGMPMSTIHDRIRKMEREKVIKAYSAVLDAEKVGKPITVFILISSKYTNPQRELAKKIAAFPEVQEVHIITGEWDLLAKMKARDLKEVGEFIIDKLRMVKGVEKTATLSAIAQVKETSDLPLEMAPPETGKNKK
jgi:DNA-binding Lrp family transcriptional regulator